MEDNLIKALETFSPSLSFFPCHFPQLTRDLPIYAAFDRWWLPLDKRRLGDRREVEEEIWLSHTPFPFPMVFPRVSWDDYVAMDRVGRDGLEWA